MSDEIDKLKEEEQVKLEEDLNEVEPRKSSPRWLGGVVLILIGLVFLLGNLFSVSFLANWWAIFILIPAIYSLSQAWQSYQAHGHLTEKGRSNLIGGLLIGTVGFIFLFGLSFGNWWPLFLIIVGLGALLKARGS